MVCVFPHTVFLDPTDDPPLSQSALFNFQSLLLVILLLICTCTYIRAVAPRLIDSNKQGYVSSAFLCNAALSPFLLLPPNACTASGNFSNSCAHPLIVFSGVSTFIRTRILGIFFMSARIGESRRASYSDFVADRPTETRVSTLCRRTVITLCSIGVHRNGRTHDTLVTFSPLYIH
jgi:hypothetical protein